MAYTYNPANGKWTQSNSPKDTASKSSTPTKTASSDSKGSTSNNLTSTNTDKDSSTGATEKEYNEIEFNTLQGTLNFIVTEETIQLKAGDTVKLQGLGSYLSGDYYVKDITRQVGSSGYSHNATLIKTNFGSSLKIKK